ncbi:uncharacterized protein LOC119325676 [Triticum dicoccoides]|uniref:uncharacterized protein LOC119325676 n=1 Tax=Triticum dicoccoides TaxID=85692 RepID=UPI001890B814|nr:uncharacterized protein LOC119325676 [Triticum dicoccoides]
MSFVELKKWREFRKNKFEWRLILVYFVQNSSDAFSSDRLQMMVILQDWEMDVMSLSVPFAFVGRKMLSVVFNGGCDIRRLPRKKGAGERINLWFMNGNLVSTCLICLLITQWLHWQMGPQQSLVPFEL